MKRTTVSVIALIPVALAVCFAARDVEWECKTSIDIGDFHRDGKNLSIKNARMETAGSILPKHYDTVPFRFEFEMRGLGKYKFYYKGNIQKIRIWQDRALKYEGAPLPEMIIGPGIAGLELEADGAVMVSVSDACSLHSFISSLRN